MKKKPWEMTRGEFLMQQVGPIGNPNSNSSTVKLAVLEVHQKYVADAIKRGDIESHPDYDEDGEPF